MREVARENKLETLVDVLDSYLFNEQSKSMLNPIRERFKLWPSNYDRSLFHNIVSHPINVLKKLEQKQFYKNGSLNKSHAERLLRAYFYLYEQISQFVTGEQKPENFADRINILMRAFLSAFQVVLIQLDENDDAQEIFASLNGKAEPLAPFDLIRNDVFHRARKKGEDNELLFESKWKHFEEPFWSVLVKQGRFKKARADHFVGHVVVAESAKEVNLGKIATEYQLYARRQKFQSVGEEVGLLSRYGEAYRALEERPHGAPTNSISKFLNTWDISTFHPLVLWLRVHVEDPDQLSKLYQAVESYVVRRDICRLGQQNYNKVIVGVVRELHASRDPVTGFAEHLTGLKGEASKMPSDPEILQACIVKNAYEIGSVKLRYIFSKVEMFLRSKYDEVTISSGNLTIEHVLPQGWAKHWPLPNGMMASHEQVWQAQYAGIELSDETKSLIEARSRKVNAIGNLTMVTDALNPSLSNAAWSEKQPRLAKSLLAMNRSIAEHSTWNEQSVDARAEVMAKAICEIWPNI